MYILLCSLGVFSLKPLPCSQRAGCESSCQPSSQAQLHRFNQGVDIIIEFEVSGLTTEY